MIFFKMKKKMIRIVINITLKINRKIIEIVIKIQ